MSRRPRRLHLIILMLFLTASPWLAATPSGAGPASVSAAERGRYLIYLPGVWVGDSFGSLPAACQLGRAGAVGTKHSCNIRQGCGTVTLS